MFYSHEILTSRKYGVATIWLVATLGSRSGLKKVGRKAILNVDVPKACETILTPDAPMALRLQSNLLYGVSRVYLQQCGYVLNDAQNAQVAMRAPISMLKQTGVLDPEAGKAKPDQLLLPDDPAFVPELAFGVLDLDLSFLDSQSLSTVPGLTSSPLLPSVSSQQGGQVGGLIVPPSEHDLSGLNIQGGERRGTSKPHEALGFAAPDEDGFLPEADWGFDAEGNMVEYAQPGGMSSTPAPLPGPAGLSSSVARDRVSGSALPVQQGAPSVAGRESTHFDLPLCDDYLLPEGEAFPTVADGQTSSVALGAEEATTDTATVPMRRKRKVPQIIPLDQTMELRNRDLVDWSTNYLENMKNESSSKTKSRENVLARRNAEYFVLGAGVGGIGSVFDADPLIAGLGMPLNNPLSIFCGDNFLSAIAGIHITPPSGTKRSTPEDDTDALGRRVRPRPDDPDALFRGEGDDMFVGDNDAGFMPPDDIEVAREAVSALEEHLSSQMPWNVSASVRGSSVRHTLGPRVASSSIAGGAGGPSSLPGSIQRRGSRLVSASPLLGRGTAELPSLQDIGDDGSTLNMGSEGMPGLDLGDDFDMYGPAAGVDTQTAAESQWQRSALDIEGNNFLTFVETAFEDLNVGRDEAEQEEDQGKANEILFEDLLPPRQNSKIVAAQGFLHTLSLATKDLIRVRQDEAFGEIGLRLMDATL